MSETTSHEHAFVPGLGRGPLTPLYDLVHRVSGLGGVHADMIRLAALAPGQRVLDVGCGTGNLLLALGRERSDVELTGLDPDARALALAARKAPAQGRGGGVAARLRAGAARIPTARSTGSSRA